MSNDQTVGLDEIANAIVARVHSILMNSTMSNSSSTNTCVTAASTGATTTATSTRISVPVCDEPSTSARSSRPFFVSSFPVDEDDNDEDLENFHVGQKRPRLLCASGERQKMKKKRSSRAAKFFTRTIYCLPFEYLEMAKLRGGNIEIPRGNRRAILAEAGLVGNLAISKFMTEADISQDVTDLFQSCFQQRSNVKFQFSFLATPKGTKVLQYPKVNPNYKWDGAGVLALSRSAIYITASEENQLVDGLQLSSITDKADCNPVKNDSIPLANDLTDDHTDTSDDLPVFNSSKRNRTPRARSLISDNFEWFCDEDVQEAKQASMQDMKDPTRVEVTFDEDDDSLEECLVILKSKIDESKVNLVNVNRRRLLEGAIRGFQRKQFEEIGRISVKFSDDIGQSEGAVDQGGPTREFFRLALDCIASSSIFCGDDTAKLLAKCESSAAKNHYFSFGRIIALSVIHCGLGPNCFSQLLYNQLVGQPRVYTLSMLRFSYVHETVSKIETASSPEQFDKAIDDANNFLQLAGISSCQFQNRNAIVERCVKFFVEDRMMPEIESFARGLNCLGLLDEMKKSPFGFQKLFLFQTDELTTTQLLDVFADIQLSEPGSNARMRENDIVCYWRDYVLDKDSTMEIKLEDILIFTTGSNRIPPLGFSPKPSIHFSSTSNYPMANTCSNCLILPLSPNNCSFDTFVSNMDFALLNCLGFGKI